MQKGIQNLIEKDINESEMFWEEGVNLSCVMGPKLTSKGENRIDKVKFRQKSFAKLDNKN